MMKKLLICMIGVSTVFCCTCSSDITTKKPSAKQETVAEEKDDLTFKLINKEENELPFHVSLQSKNGGYRIAHNDIELTVEVVNEEKHILLKNPVRTMELFANDKDITLFVEENGNVSYYYEAVEQDFKINYDNPMISRMQEMKDLGFEKQDAITYVSNTTIQVPVQEQINCVVNKISMTWKDEEYQFEYFVYEDGATLLSADVPEEMHPMINKTTKWVVELEKKQMKNTETQETVPFQIIGTKDEKAISPNDLSKTEDVSYQMMIQIDENNNVKKIVTTEGDKEVTIETIYHDKLTIPYENEEGLKQIDVELARELIQVMFMMETMF